MKQNNIIMFNFQIVIIFSPLKNVYISGTMHM